MSYNCVPHRPTQEEIDIVRSRGIAADDALLRRMLEGACRAFDLSRFDDALSVLKSIVMLRPDDAVVYETFGMVYQGAGRLDDAIACFEYALKVDSKAPYARVNLGEIAWRRQKDPVRARALLEPLIAADPSSPLAKRGQITLRQLIATRA